MIGFPLGLLYANALEWGIHRYVLHGLGKKPSSFFAFHWHEHHRAARKNAMHDAAYEDVCSSGFTAKNKEGLALALLALAHMPLVTRAPFFCAAVVYSSIEYYRVHKRAHLDPQWARENVPWHVDHHMGADQNANWCVTRPWFDDLLKTRKKYVGTPAEQAFPRKKAERSNQAEPNEHENGLGGEVTAMRDPVDSGIELTRTDECATDAETRRIPDPLESGVVLTGAAERVAESDSSAPPTSKSRSAA